MLILSTNVIASFLKHCNWILDEAFIYLVRLVVWYYLNLANLLIQFDGDSLNYSVLNCHCCDVINLFNIIYKITMSTHYYNSLPGS